LKKPVSKPTKTSPTQHHSTNSPHKSPADVSRHVAALARQNAADKPVPPPMKIHQLVKKIIPPKRSFAPPAPRPVLPGNRSAAKLSAAGGGSAPIPVVRYHAIRDLASRRRVTGDAPAARGPAMGLQAEYAALGRKVMAGWRREVPVMRAATRRRGTGQVLAAIASGGAGDGVFSGVSAALRSLRVACVPKRGGGPSGLGEISFAPRGRAGGSQVASGNRHGVPAMDAPAPAAMAAPMHNPAQAPVKARLAAGAPGGEMASTVTGNQSETANPLREGELAEALRAYFFRQSRMPLSSMTGFDPRVSPAWAGLQMPG